MKTKYYLDTEFIEDGKTIDLISLGLVCDDGRTLYLQNVECDFSQANDWVWRNVFPHLVHFDMSGGGQRKCSAITQVADSGLSRTRTTKCGVAHDGYPCMWATRQEIKEAVLAFCDVEKFGKPEFWGYFADYDWVVFCQLFGRMIDLPNGFPMYCRDLKQFADELDVRLPKPAVEVHHALSDAEWVRESYAFLREAPKAGQ